MRIPLISPRMLIEGDNLPFMRWLPDESVDLIATDPPFSKGKTFASADGQHRFADTWRWSDESAAQLRDIAAEFPNTRLLIDYARTFNAGLAAYLCFMGVRLVEMRRLLKDTGSVYLHCDPTASHYLKALMDAVFGDKQFRNSIIWAYTAPSNVSRWFPRKHDDIHFYAKSQRAAKFNADAVRVPYEPSTINRGKYDSASPIAGSGLRDISHGKTPEDWWNDIPAGGQISNNESVGYPTQKPLALYERIIAASSDEGDLVLDPFCGSGTTLVAAERLGRRWIGVDLWEGGYEMIAKRLSDNLQLLSDANPSIKYYKWTENDCVNGR